MSKFYVIGTPIGNLEDITFRAVETLKSVDLVLCEDTFMTKRLLERYSINTPTQSYHSQSTISKIEHILDLLQQGKNLALVSDAGTPGISDPGSLLISMIKERLGAEVQIIPIPGPSAVIAALSASGVPTAQFVFLGFLPHKKGRQTLFKEIAEAERTMVFYESPHRILKTLESLKEVLTPDRKVVIARELTKVFEEFVTGSAEEVLTYFTSHDDKVRGEFTVIVAPR